MSHRVATFSLVLALVVSAFAARQAHAAEAPPPVGTWRGEFPDGSAVGLMLQANGSCMYGPIGGTPVVGTASWNPTATGGILTLTYYNAGMESHAYYSVTWIDRSSFVLSDPYFRVQMRRQ